MTPSVLLVEDDEDEAKLARNALRKASVRHHLLRARDGDAAVALAGEDQPIDLIVLDLHLPRLDGKAVLEAVRRSERLRRVPVVMYSSSREPRDLADCYSRGANSYLHKSTDLRTFTDDLSLVLFYWLCLNALPGETAAHRTNRHASQGVEAEQLRARPSARVMPSRTEAEQAHDHTFGRQAAAVVVDADPHLRRLAAEALSEVAGPVPVLEAARSEEAQERLLRARICHGHPAWSCARLILVDLDANLEDGVALIRDARAHVDHRLPLVVFTANDTSDFVERCYDLQVNSVIRKPDPASFPDTVRLLGHYWLRLNETVPAPDLLPV